MNRHNAPPVVYPLERSFFLGTLLLVLWFAGLLALLLWFHSISRLDWRIGVAFSAVLGAGLAARTGWSHMPSGQLAWSGETWRWESPSYQTGSTEQALSVIADFQQMLLLRLENQTGASLWLWLERSAMPDRWLDLRRAIYSPHRSPAARQHDLLPGNSFASTGSPALAVPAPSAIHPVKVPPEAS